MDNKTKIKLKYIFLYLIVSTLTIYIFYMERQSKVQEYLDNQGKQTNSNYKALYNKYKNLSSVVYTTRINNDRIKQIYKDAYKSDDLKKEKIRKELLKILGPTYELLREFNIKQLHFHLPDNESFLRFHRPSKFGDNLTGIRSTVEYVNKYKKPINGFEEGRIFNGYRFVYPLFDNLQNHIGSVEISFSSLAFHIEYMQDYHLFSNFLVLRSAVDKKVFEDEKRNYISSPFKSFYYEKSIYDNLKKHYKAYDDKKVSQEVLDKIELELFKGNFYSIYDGQNNVIKTYIPVYNPITAKLSAVYVSVNSGEYIAGKVNNFYLLSFTIIILLGIIFYFIYKNALVSLSKEKLINELSVKAKELEEYKRVLDESDIVSKADLKGKITYVNKKFTDITGYAKEELIGKPHSIVRHPDVPKNIFKNMWKIIKNKQTFKGIIKNKRKDGSSYYVDATIVPVLDLKGEIKEYIGVRHDITDIMNPKKQFLDHLNSTNEPVAVLARMANYSLLKEFYGEAYIQKVEEYLSCHILNFLPKRSILNKVYSLDNGEFAFVREKENCDIDIITACLKEFQENINKNRFIIQGNKIDISMYMVFTTQKKEAFENLKIGIYKAVKENIKILCSDDFSIQSRKKAKDNMKIVNLLKSAVNKDEAKIISLFQPIFNNQTGEIDKYESLARLINKQGEMISPYFFIDVSKKASLYADLTGIVLDNSFEALNKTDKDITINLSTIDIENKHIRNKLLNLIKQPKFIGRVTYELLEDELAKDFELVKEFIELSKKEGKIKVAIDDFGSGYSNFERLVEFQPDILKIDGSLIKNIVHDKFSAHVVEAIVLFAKKENIKTVAEFVADEKIFEKVKSLGIDYSQGFYLGEPSTLENKKGLEP